ncbi:ATP-binding protein [Calothrix sp. 336/3]|uniref:ATP-binding protein n=1 Tax=Calothrix sp. 336/3 TaxID=1337936 RepID=UPI0004E4646C|nr:ATP-binding protein [Calothrix sp. 336/3]AKG24089.1 pilus assembly protein PilB [Calothrix sp. 336/3]
MSRDTLADIYNSFNPFETASKEAYVDCREVRGNWEVYQELGKKIVLSDKPTCQLCSGHRGTGKSTELLRLKENLENRGFFVIYFAVDDQDIEPEDVEYADILMACTRHLVEAVKIEKHNPLLEWMQERWESFKDLMMMELSFEGLSLEQQISQFSKITATIKAVPDKRREIRQKINANTPSLVEALNDFIVKAEEYLSKKSQGKSSKKTPSQAPEYQGLVVIVDNLDRIVEVAEEGKPNNYQEIYLNRSEMLRSLKCHIIYTVPIDVVYSDLATNFDTSYHNLEVVPMMMVRNPDGTINEAGLKKLRQLISQRVGLVEPALEKVLDEKIDGLDITPMFDSPETLNQLCLMSGGHMRDLMKLIQGAIENVDQLPITAKAAKRAIDGFRETYRKAIQEHHWEILAQANHCKDKKDDKEHLRLLRNRSLLEYRYYDDDDNLQIWCDVHPLIEATPKFQSAISQIQP